MTVCFAFAAHLICLPEQWCVGDVLMFDCVVFQQWNSLIIFVFLQIFVSLHFFVASVNIILFLKWHFT